MLSSVEQAFVGRDEKRAPLKKTAWEATSHLAYLAILVEVTREVENQLPGNPKCTMTPSLLITSRKTSNESIGIYQQLITLRLAILVGVTCQVTNQLPRNPKFTLTPTILMTSRAQGRHQPNR